MVTWFWCLHSWNRILPSSVLLALATMTFLGTLTSERAIVMPFAATFIWLCGWAAIGASRLVRNLCASESFVIFGNSVRIDLRQV